MASALVLGAGWAGLAAAHDLRRKGLEVRVLERSASAGGLGRSFPDPDGGSDELDNGQHLLLESYTETLRLLRQAGLARPLEILRRLSLPLFGPSGIEARLSAPPLPSFMALPWSLLRLKGISLGEKVKLLWGPLLGGLPPREDESVEQLLNRWRQPESLRRLFWRPLTLGTLNTDSGEASAALLVRVLWQGFLRRPFGSRFALATTGLSHVLPEPLRKVLEARDVAFSFREPCTSLEIQEGRVAGVISRGGRHEADVVVSALPWEAAAALAPGLMGGGLQPSPIVTAYLWMDRPLMDSPMAGLIDRPFDWIFDRGILFGRGAGSGPLALVKSSADNLAGKGPSQIAAQAEETLALAFPGSGAKVLRASVYKEMRATFKAAVGVDRLRPGPRSPYPNLFLAGAWTATGLPATLEGAVRSGRVAARAAIESLT